MNKLTVRMIALIVILGMVLGIIGLVWQGMQHVPPNWARLWALLATGAIPVAAWAGWWFGHTEARGILRGFDKAVDRLMVGLSKAAGLGISTTRAMRRPVMQEPPVVVLPDVEIVQRQLPRGEEVIEV